MDALKRFDLDQWWKLLAIAGALIVIVSIPSLFGPGVLVGIGLMLFGVGEWANHPSQADILPSSPWIPNTFGLTLDALGIGLFGFGIYQLV